MRIVVLDGYTLNPGDNPWDAVAGQGDLEVHERTPADQIVARAAGAPIVLTNKTPLSADTISQLPDLKFISVLATGYNVVDVKAAQQRQIPCLEHPRLRHRHGSPTRVCRALEHVPPPHTPRPSCTRRSVATT